MQNGMMALFFSQVSYLIDKSYNFRIILKFIMP